ncbi:TPA: LysR family transcriptional regulator substrate-binding protein, partial [Streptococcus agalactiae]
KVASLNEHYMLGEMLPRKCRALGFDPHIVFKHNDWEVLIHSLQDLNAVTILPSEFESISQVQDLCWVPLKDKNNFYPIGIAYRNDTSFSPMIEEFLSLLKTN